MMSVTGCRVGTCLIVLTMNWEIHPGVVFGLATSTHAFKQDGCSSLKWQ